MKKSLCAIILCSCMIGAVSASSFSGCEEKMFTVTSYYSPENGQVFYYKPSFQDEVTLNGEWYTGASWKAVFQWMLAWPASYSFWSLIYFPGWGIGEIADRGGAIVLSGERDQLHDRIDIWMGKGEEGLIRALTFGKKNLTWYLCNSSIIKTEPSEMLDRNTVPVLKNFFDVAIRIEQLDVWRNDIRVRTLQKYLNKLWYLSKKYRNGNYDTHTKRALCAYQTDTKIVSVSNPDCWIFGAHTRYAMKMDVQARGLLPTDLYEIGTFDEIISLAKYYNGTPTEIPVQMPKKTNMPTTKIVQPAKPAIFLFYRAYTKNQQSSEIKTLQIFLQQQGFYTWKIDGIYTKTTVDALYDFQKKYTLISDSDPLMLRGFLWPKTRSKINDLRNK